MKEKALEFYRQDCNCCQCILKAFEYKYGTSIPQEILCMCQGISSGFGIGGMCGLLIAGVMIFGIMYDEAVVKSLRIQLLDEFVKSFGNLNCRALSKTRNGQSGCEDLVAEAAVLISKLIEEERNS